MNSIQGLERGKQPRQAKLLLVKNYETENSVIPEEISSSNLLSKHMNKYSISMMHDKGKKHLIIILGSESSVDRGYNQRSIIHQSRNPSTNSRSLSKSPTNNLNTIELEAPTHLKIPTYLCKRDYSKQQESMASGIYPKRRLIRNDSSTK